MFWFIVVILLLALSFFIGYRVGQKKQSGDAQAKQQAWQEGYNAATNYAAREAKQAAPVAVQLPQPPSNAPPTVQPQTEWTANVSAQSSPAGVYAQPTLKPAAPQAPARPVKVLTARERELRNINVTLYVAALLIVAAAALFLSFALPPLPKLISLFVLAAAFYGVGLYVHAAKENLKPAASAFAGTGLALLPLAGIATYQTLSLSAPVVWLIFSVIGTLAVGFATIRLRSRVLAWIAVFVLVSTTMACAATVQRGILFYLLFLLLLSVLLLVLAVRSEKVRSSLFYSAVFATGQLLPLLVLGLALVMYSSLNPRDLLWVFFLVTAHLLLTIVLIERFRLYRLYAARVTFMLLIFATGNYLGMEPEFIWAISAVLWAGQALAVTHFAHGYRQLFVVPASWWRSERIALWALVVGSALVAVTHLAGPQVPWWYAVLLIPVLQIFTLNALRQRGKIEAVAIVLLAILAMTASGLFAWRVLPALAVAIIGLTLAFRNETQRRWHLVLDLTRWLGVLVFGGFVGRALQELLTGFGEPTGVAQGYGRAATVFESLNLAWVVGLWLPLFALWLLSTLRSKRQVLPTREHLIHFGASVLLAVITLSYVVSLQNQVAGREETSFLTLSAGTWLGLGIILALVNVILAGWRLDSRGQQRDAQLLRIMVLVASAALLMLSFQGSLLIVVIVGLTNLGFYLLNARKVHAPHWKTVYASAAQLTFSVCIWWFANYLLLDYSGRFALMIVSVMLPQLVRLFLVMRAKRPLSLEMRWITVGLVCLLPLVLLVGDLGFGLYDRGTMLLGISLWIIHSVKGFYALRKQTQHAEFLLFATVIGLCGLIYLQGVQSFEVTGWIHGPWWSVQVAQILLLAVALLALGAQWPLRNSSTLRFAPVFGTLFALLTIALVADGAGWIALVLLVSAVQLGLLVHTRKIAWLAAGSSVALLGAIGQGIGYWREGSSFSLQPWMDPTWQLLLTAILLLVISLLHGRFAEQVPHYPRDVRFSKDAAGQAARVYFAAMILSTAVAGSLMHFNDLRTAWIIAGALLIFVAGAVIRFFELPARFGLWGSDALIALAALLAFSSYVQIRQMPVLSIFFLYFAVLAIILAARHFVGKRGRAAHKYVIVGAVLASLTQISTLIDGNGFAQVFSLFFFAALIVLGLKLGQKRYIWWGAIAITVAVLWFLRYLAFLWLVLAGVGLIVAAVLKLVRVERKPRSEEQPAQSHAEFGQDENSRPDQDNLNS
ncbi:hypothetical protein [Arthrobacter sp. MYb213]|uniref:hypothetical protein n=1 Tax=Arthrobacter sp. MYb213 TaxID=1848595 RepID=UPI000CFC0834|nr:hypothetical protein [Arthrobacter sp. MYb213]PRB71405.1 hypothetical protein CQ011_05755 [Arthrobacter sp. MYb213]